MVPLLDDQTLLQPGILFVELHSFKVVSTNDEGQRHQILSGVYTSIGHSLLGEGSEGVILILHRRPRGGGVNKRTHK